METEVSGSSDEGPTLADRVLEFGKAAFDPSLDEATRAEKTAEFDKFIDK